jgi:hypothetical protein
MRGTRGIVVAVAAVALALGAVSIAVASGAPQVKLNRKHGLLVFHQVNGDKTQHSPPGRMHIIRVVHPNGQKVLSIHSPPLIRGDLTAEPGSYRFISFARHCHRCTSQHPTIFGRKFSECSTRVRLKAKMTTSVRVRVHRKHPCTIRVRGPYHGE